MLCMAIVDGHNTFEWYISKIIVSMAHVDGLTPGGARASTGTLLISVGCIIYLKLACEI